MESFTTNGWVILGLTLVIGWLLGLLSRSGGSKWKSAYNREHEALLSLRKEHDGLLKEHDGLRRDHDGLVKEHDGLRRDYDDHRRRVVAAPADTVATPVATDTRPLRTGAF